MDYKEQNNYPKAFLATGIILVVMAALCYFIVFDNTPPPIEGTGGILVNYGTTDAGMGNDFTSMEQPAVAEKANHAPPTKLTPAPPSEQKPETDNSDKKIVTQSNEDAPEINANKKPSNTVSTQATKSVAKPTINQNALYKGKPNNGTGMGDGTTNTPGNQGKPTGSTLTNNYNGTGSGNGGQIGLGQRSFVSKPDVSDEHRAAGRVVIDFLVDKNGNITQAGIGRGTTIVDDALIERCINAVKNSHVTANDNAPDDQRGRFTFVFKLN